MDIKKITRYQILRRASLIYESKKYNHGLCYSISFAIQDFTGARVYYSDLYHIIPLFVSAVLVGRGNIPSGYFWWPQSDFESRRKALKFLMEQYESDTTDVLPIIEKYS